MASFMLHCRWVDKLVTDYKTGKFFDEAFINDECELRPFYKEAVKFFDKLKNPEMEASLRSLERNFLMQGITFTVYSDGQGTERIFPFDPFPRIIPADEWEVIEKGLLQRVSALNLFLKDIYSKRQILKDGVVPESLVKSSKHNRAECSGLELPYDVYMHICGTDLIRDDEGTYRVLEDNGRCPSGVSYMLENRVAMKRTFPELYRKLKVEPVRTYPAELLKMLKSVSPRQQDDPVCVLLTPGQYNSAYFEHTFLARQMGIEIVEGRDLFVDNDRVYMHTTMGPVQVDVIYRRIDDDFLDPNFFNRESMLGVPDLMKAYREGNVSLVNAVGTGVADDKATYSYVPAMIKYYLDEEPILPNVHTYLGSDESDLKYMLENVESLVIKAVDEAGGYGMLIGPSASKKECEEFRAKVKSSPRGYVAQPVISLSTHPTFCDNRLEGRHIDLRPFVLTGEKSVVIPGGLTRVALKKGSLVVNSSQGGGSKDTWVLRDPSSSNDSNNK
ncbi:MAG: circularly permuted type 2 ATP-grasp protein [Verrucomicrobiales bacterium]|nr:circularly permuted type 2 ATP-grasp protein [Verrucomicrobiales bacterium]